MAMRVSVFVVCVGAVLALATDVPVSGVNLTVVGVTVVGAGALGLLMTLLVWDPRPLVDRSPVEQPEALEEGLTREDQPAMT
jgi:hypothetical protein